MKKMSCLFVRPDRSNLVTEEVMPGCEWVLNGEGVATRKFDGTACLFSDGALYRRYDAKHGRTPPMGFIPAQSAPDPITLHWPGWIEVTDEDKWHRQGMQIAYASDDKLKDPWTYELCGPKINGNPENLLHHRLIAHGCVTYSHIKRDFEGIRAFLMRHNWIEGLVFWRDLRDLECEKVKIRRKDYGLPWPIKPIGEV